MEPDTLAGREGLRAAVADPASALVVMDYDGTLSPIVPDPDAAFAQPGTVAVLARLLGRIGTVAVLTGRPVTAVRRLAGLDEAAGVDGLELLGQYGVERWDAATGEVRAPEPPPGVSAAREELPALLARLGAADAYVEDKGRALAVHLRRTADPQAALARLREPLAELADRHGLHLEPGKLVLELRASGTDKGAALQAFAAERRARAVVFAGDDLGDLAAYDAVERLRSHGVPGVLLCSMGAERTELADRADLVLDGPAGVIAWLDALADRLSGRG